MGRVDVYSQPEASDPVLSSATVLRLARAHVGRAEAVTGVDESGGEARAYLVDEGVMVKTQRPHRVRARTSLAKEARLLEYLAQELVGPVPTVFGYDRMDTAEGSVEYLVMSRIPGRAARHASVTGSSPSDRRALKEGYLDGESPAGDFEAVWTAAMIYADMKAITGGAELAEQASVDLTRRLATL